MEDPTSIVHIIFVLERGWGCVMGGYVIHMLAWRAYRVGNFRLKCGEQTHEIVDCSNVLRTRRDIQAVAAILPRVPRAVHGVGGPMSGADGLAIAHLFRSPLCGRSRLYWCGVRAARKTRGVDPGYIVGPVQKGHRIRVVEDVLTTGHTVADAILRLREAGAVVKDVLVLVERDDFAGATFLRDRLDVRVHSLYKLSDLRRYREQSKPLG